MDSVKSVRMLPTNRYDDFEDVSVERVFYENFIEACFNSSLSDREKLVLTRRFGLDGGKMCTLDEVGAELGATRERVRQIEAKALRKLRCNKNVKAFK